MKNTIIGRHIYSVGGNRVSARLLRHQRGKNTVQWNSIGRYTGAAI